MRNLIPNLKVTTVFSHALIEGAKSILIAQLSWRALVCWAHPELRGEKREEEKHRSKFVEKLRGSNSSISSADITGEKLASQRISIGKMLRAIAEPQGHESGNNQQVDFASKACERIISLNLSRTIKISKISKRQRRDLIIAFNSE